MSPISETCTYGHKILILLTIFSFATSEMERDYQELKRSMRVI